MLSRIAALLRMRPPVVLNRGLLFSSGATVPVDDTDGFQTGCLYQHTDGGNGTALYVNEGSVTACAFKAVESGDYGAYASSCATGSAVVVSASKTAVLGIFGEFTTDPGSGSNLRSVRSRLLVSTAGNCEAETYAVQGQLVAAASNLGHWHAGVLGTIERCSGTVRVYNPLAGVGAVMGRIGGNITVDTGGWLAGLVALGLSTVTLTNGVYAGLYITKAAGSNWSHGVYVEDSTIGIYLAGTSTTGIDFAGTYTGNAMDFSNATIDPTGSGGPCFIRMGAYGTEIDYGADNHQSGAIRIYTTCSGDISSYDRGVFVCTVTTGAKAAYPVAGLAEANNTGTGPRYLGGGQFIAHLGARSSGAHLVTLGGSAGLLCGMYGAWLKVAATGTAVCDSGSRVAAAWIDNQMSGTVSGDEFGIFATTGASVPDAFIGFSTGAGGYSQFLSFDTTFDSSAGACVTTDAVPANAQDARILVWYDSKQYYIPLWR